LRVVSQDVNDETFGNDVIDWRKCSAEACLNAANSTIILLQIMSRSADGTLTYQNKGSLSVFPFYSMPRSRFISF
jgi:hypothetical protein